MSTNYSTYRSISVLNTGLVVKAAAGQLYSLYVGNNGAAANYLKIYDKATAPTASDTPVMTLYLPIASANNFVLPDGVTFLNGISIRATTLIADNNNTAPGANEVTVVAAYL